jgi:rod shape-determining protein MreC
VVAYDHAPPPFFRRGATPLALLSFYVALSIALFVMDMRFHALDRLRQGISVLTDPLQRLAQSPPRLAANIVDYFSDIDNLKAENRALQTRQLANAPALNRLQQLEAENAHLRNLLNLRVRDTASGQFASILHTARDPFARRVYLDKGINHGLEAGQPVIDAIGIIGQVTRTFPFSAEVTLLTDKNQAVPVQVQRTGQRSITFGLGDGRVELKYMPTNADVVDGDLLVTSGLDGVYPAGFPVARVTHVERGNPSAFARIIAEPVAAVESHNIVMALTPREQPASPEATVAEPSRPARNKPR